MNERELLSSGAAEMGITLTSEQLDLFDAFTALLLDWNSRLNLTRITDPAEIAVKHYLDSLSILAHVQIAPDASIIDIGTGAGLPGIPLKIALPKTSVTMLDSVKKKLTFIEAAAKELHLSDVRVLHSRAEDAGINPAYRERFDFATSRAVAKLSVLTELALPFCRVGGAFVAYKSSGVDEEAEEAARAISTLGGKLEGIHRFMLPESDISRALVVVRKVKKTPNGYPRKAGTPSKEPIV